MRLGILRAGERGARELAGHSRGALDRALTEPGELWVGVAADEAVLLGAFQRGIQQGMRVGDGLPQMHRGSGGPEVWVRPGTVHIALALAHPAVFVPCDEKRIVNRMVRPLLKALTKVGALAHFFGRDWVSVAHRPAAWVGFAHDAVTRRTLFEAFVAVHAPFAPARESFLGKEPTTLDAIAGAPFAPSRLVDAIVDAYVGAWAAEAVPLADDDSGLGAAGAVDDTPWAATVEEAIGTLGAGPDARGVFRVGGSLLASRDAVARLEVAAPTTPDDDLGALVDATLAGPGVALDGIRSLARVRDLIVSARGGPVVPAPLAPTPSRP
jgi:hypothetical protein